jgi:hypothetical protein
MQMKCKMMYLTNSCTMHFCRALLVERVRWITHTPWQSSITRRVCESCTIYIIYHSETDYRAESLLWGSNESYCMYLPYSWNFLFKLASTYYVRGIVCFAFIFRLLVRRERRRCLRSLERSISPRRKHRQVGKYFSFRGKKSNYPKKNSLAADTIDKVATTTRITCPGESW